MFLDRTDAARHLAALLKGRDLVRPLVLGIPRGGVVIASVIAKELGAELDVVLSRKLRAPQQPELAVGAVTENGAVILNDDQSLIESLPPGYLDEEKQRQLAEIAQRRARYRAVRPQAEIAGRSVIVTDDGIATGSTMAAALKTVRAAGAARIILAAPVASPRRLDDLRRLCDEAVCPIVSDDFWAIGQFYTDFGQVDDETVINLLRAAPSAQAER